MKINYLILEDENEIIYDNCSQEDFNKTEYDSFEDVAELCAKYDYNNCDGWEYVDEWKKGRTVVLFNKYSKEKMRNM